MYDIVIPNGNEKEFILLADKLGFKGLVFLYDYSQFLLLKDKVDNKNVKIGVLATNKNIDKIRNNIDENTLVVVKSSLNAL